jgi:hypothetical protein
MADGKPVSCTSTLTRQVQSEFFEEAQLSVWQAAEFLNNTPNELNGIRDKESTTKSAAASSNGSHVQRGREVDNPSQVLELESNEPPAMLKLPTAGSTETAQPESPSKVRPCDTSTSSAPPHSQDELVQVGTISSRPSAQDVRSEVDFDVQVRQIRARERIVILRRRVIRTRRLMKNKRSKLRQLREIAQDALDKLMRKLNESEAFGSMQEDLRSLYQNLHEAQDTLGPAEYAYGMLESQLDDEEQDLEEEEDYFYRHHDVTSFSIADSRLDDDISPLVKPYAAPETELQRLDLNSENNMTRGYLDKLSEAGRLKDDLDILEEKYFQRSTDASFRKRHEIALSTETAIFLTEYPKLRSDILETLRAVEDDIFDLRSKCLDQDLFTESEFVYERRDALYEDVMDSVYDARDRSPLRIAAHENKYDERETNFGDKREYVNNWLLQWIQDSAFESLVLKTWIYFEYPERPEKDKILEGDKWSDLAVENWDRDSAGKEANKNTSANRLDAIAGETGRLNATTTGISGFPDSLGSLDVAPGDGEMAQGALLAIEAGSNATQTARDDDDSTPQSSPRKEKNDDV